MKKTKKILHAITGFCGGGAEEVVISLVQSAVKDGHEVAIVALHKKTPDLIPHCDGIETIHLGMSNALDVIPALLAYMKIIKKFKPEIIHAHMFHAIILSRLARLLFFAPISRPPPPPSLVSTIHNSVDGGRGRALIYRMTQFLDICTVNVSHEAKLMFEHSGAAKKNSVIPIANGIDATKYIFSDDIRRSTRMQFGIKEKEIFILSVGRIAHQKNLFNLINAAAIVKKVYGVKIFICGSGDASLRLELENFSHALGLVNVKERRLKTNTSLATEGHQ